MLGSVERVPRSGVVKTVFKGGIVSKKRRGYLKKSDTIQFYETSDSGTMGQWEEKTVNKVQWRGVLHQIMSLQSL